MVDVPSVRELNELNRVIIGVGQLAPSGQSCDVKLLLAWCTEQVLGGMRADHLRTLRIAQAAGFLRLARSRVSRTDEGNVFCSLNQEARYEVTPQQREYVARKLLLSGAWSAQSRALLQLFSPNFDVVTFELSASRNALPRRYSAAASILQGTCVLEVDESRMWVAPPYVAAVRDLRSDRRGMSQEELEMALMANKTLGSQAEEAVRAFERRRLRALGRSQEARIARRISDLSADAGYDIESFDGTRPTLDHDRYIEVKASSGSEVRFFWTRNQYLVAQSMRARYWIYFVPNFRQRGSSYVEPIMVQDPIATLPRVPNLSLETAEYFVYQRGDVPLALDDTRGVRARRPVLSDRQTPQP